MHLAIFSPRLAPEPAAREKTRATVFSEQLRALITRLDDKPMQMQELLVQTEGRGLHLLLVLMALPFITPIPLPGFSIPFGAAIAWIGVQLIAGRALWMPQKILRRELSPQFLTRLLGATTRIVQWLEFCVRPRLAFLQERIAFRRVGGALIGLCGLYLMLPIPLPLSNSLPAWTVLLLAAGALGKDGLFFIFGCIAFAVTSTFFALLAYAWMTAFEVYARIAFTG